MTCNIQHPGSIMNTFLRCCEEEITKPLMGEIKGTIPVWLNGNLLRNGPGRMKIGSSAYEHVFDGSALLHRFALNKGTVTYQCRYLESQTFMKNKKADRIIVSEFGTKAVPDPCNTIFKRFESIFNLEDIISDNAGISVNAFGDQVYAMTDVATVYRFDPQSLETLEKKSLINSLIVCHSAHPHKMPNGDVYNIGLKIVLGLPKYVIVKFPYSKTGTIPVWLNGNLLRNGPGRMKIGSSAYEHVFDGSALLHRFALNKGTVTYQCRYLESQTFMKNKKADRIIVSEFGTKAVPDPCNTIFKRFDPQSLETLEKKSLINSLIVCHSAHPHKMPNGDVYNIGLKIVLGLPKYVIVKFPYSKTDDMFDLAEVVSEIEPRWRFNPSYMHSFGITDNYYIIIEQPLSISLASVLKAIILNDSFSSTLTWNSECETQIILVNRRTNVQTRYRTNALFFMHIVNAFEENGKIIIDICAYDDAKVIEALYVEAIKNMESNPDYAHWCHSYPKRLEIPLDSPAHTKIEAKLLADIKIELPGINYLYNGHSYRYLYGIGSTDEMEFANSIVKIDTYTGNVKIWSEFDAFPSEPVFVATEDGKQEDDGILLSVLLWGTNDHAVTLLVLNARDLSEIARANFITPSQAPNCIHGCFLKDNII